LAPEAALRLALIRFSAGDANLALLEAQRFQQRFPDDAERVAQAILIEARALNALERRDEARQRLSVLADRYPDSAAAADAARIFPGVFPGPSDGD
ncbi:MAG: tetratricopeptide repeat protein, partial [Bacteroidota bacterium]